MSVDPSAPLASPIHLVEFELLHAVPQPVFAILPADHPLAEKDPLRLRDCLDYPHVVPGMQYGARNLLERAAAGSSRVPSPIVETDSFELIRHYVLEESSIGFQIPIGLRASPERGLVLREVSTRDVPAGNLFLGQMKGRTLPVASARFALQLASSLQELDAANAGD